MSGEPPRYRDGFWTRRQLQGDRHVERLADIDHDALALDTAESLQFGGHVVRADWQRGEADTRPRRR